CSGRSACSTASGHATSARDGRSFRSRTPRARAAGSTRRRTASASRGRSTSCRSSSRGCRGPDRVPGRRPRARPPLLAGAARNATRRARRGRGPRAPDADVEPFVGRPPRARPGAGRPRAAPVLRRRRSATRRRARCRSRRLRRAPGRALGDLSRHGRDAVRARAAVTSRVARGSRRSLETIVVCAQENRSFDHYYGFAAWVGSFGVPDGYSQPAGRGGTVRPYRATGPSTPDPGHSWAAMYTQWKGGRMDGFYATNGLDAMCFYGEAELPFYCGLFEEFTRCAAYFSSVMGPTYPNRLSLAAGTAGGLTTNGVFGYGILDYPCILDLLDGAGVSWAVYELGDDDVEAGDSDNVFVFFERYADDPRA